MKIKYLLPLILAVICSNANAAGAFDSIVAAFANSANKWATTYMPIASYIFWLISFLEFGYQLVFKKLLPNDITKLAFFVVSRTTVIALLAKFVLDINVYTDIVSWLVKLGSMVGGVNLSGGPLIDYSPSALWGELWQMFSPTIITLITAAGTVGLLNSSIANFLFTLTTVIFGVMLIMVVIVMLTMIEAYFVIFAGCFLAGFAGASWTMNYWQKYLSFVAGVGVRLMFTSLILGAFKNQWSNAASWLQPVEFSMSSPIDSTVAVCKNLFAMLGVFTFDMVLLVTFPSKAAAMLNGAVNAGLGEAIGAASMALSGGRMLSAPATGGAGAMKSFANAALEAPGAAKSAAFKAMRDGLKNNIGDGSGGGSDDKFRQALRQQGANAAKDATTKTMKGAATEGKSAWQQAVNATKQNASNFAGKAGGTGSGTSGGSNLNLNPHN